MTSPHNTIDRLRQLLDAYLNLSFTTNFLPGQKLPSTLDADIARLG
jgi:hypothetical protein